MELQPQYSMFFILKHKKADLLTNLCNKPNKVQINDKLQRVNSFDDSERCILQTNVHTYIKQKIKS